MMKATSVTHKFIICLLAGLVLGETFLRIADRFLTRVLPNPIVFAISVAIAAAALVYPFIWQRREKTGLVDGRTVHALWLGALRYGIAFDIAMFGFQKIFHYQFNTPMAMLDEPFSSLSMQNHVWAFFGLSYAYSCVIAVSQIAASMLMVINRTKLLGAVALFPIMVNIILIDFFYELNTGVIIHAVILMAGLMYVLWTDYDRLVGFFINHKSTVEVISTPNIALKMAGRMSILFVPLILVAMKESPNKDPDLKGKYTVVDMKVNGIPRMAKTSMDSVLTLVYFDISNDCVFEFNGISRRMYGGYTLNDAQQVSTSWYFPPAAKTKGFNGILRRENSTEIELIGSIQNDSIQVRLKRMHR